MFPAGKGSLLTIGLPGGAATAQPHDDGSVGQLPLHAVLPDAVQDIGREMDVQVTQEHDAVLVLGRDRCGSGESKRNSPGREATARAGPCPHSPPPCPHQPGAQQSAQNSLCAADIEIWGERTGQVALGTDRDTARREQEPPAWGKNLFRNMQVLPLKLRVPP